MLLFLKSIFGFKMSVWKAVLKDSSECFHTHAIVLRLVPKTRKHVSVTLEVLESNPWSYFSVHNQISKNEL